MAAPSTHALADREHAGKAETILPVETEPFAGLVADPAALPVVVGYEVVRLVGRGGMGRVYEARHVGLGRTVALKLLAHEADGQSLARFRDEARAVARLGHPSVAQLYETGVAAGQPYYAQEFLAGGSLAEKYAGRPQPPAEAAALVEAVARAVDYCHAQGVVHRDLKPANVMLAIDGTPKVVDFGLAKLAAPADAATAPDGLTRTGDVLGTPSYMAPEQASGVVSALGPRVDVYALGAVLYEALTGRPPFQAPSVLETLIQVMARDPVAPRSLQPAVPRDLETVCLKCLEKSPAKRYATAGALADDLRRYLNGEPVVARPAGVAERAAKWARRKPWQAAAAGLAAAGVVGLAGGLASLAGMYREVRAANADLTATNAQLDRSRAESEATLNYALASLDEYHFALADKLRDVPQGEKLRLEVLVQARKTLDDLAALDPRRPTVQSYLMDGYSRLAAVQSQVGDLDGAVHSFTQSRAAATRLLAGDPDSIDNRCNRATAGYQCANVLDRLGRPGAPELWAEGERDAAELAAGHPDHPGVLKLQVLAAARALLAAVTANRMGEYAATCGRLGDLYRRLAAAEPGNAKSAAEAINWDLRRAAQLARSGKPAEAEAVLATANAALDRLPDPAAVPARQLRATWHETAAAIHDALNRPAEVDAEYRRTLAVYQALAADFPRSPNYSRWVVTTLLALGTNARFSGRPVAAAAYYRWAHGLAADLVKAYPADAQMPTLLDSVTKAMGGAP